MTEDARAILALEKSMFRLEYMQNADYLGGIIDDGYRELGKSGRLFTKRDEMEMFARMVSDRNIHIYNYSCEQIDACTFLAHYVTRSGEKTFYRSSIWRKKGDGYAILFHQASPYTETCALTEF
ncbi:MAG: DUF4440 domain-containing protein [Aristaeellaceae bacterium]